MRASLHLTTLSQAAPYTPQWRLGVGYEFEQRPDGLPGLSAAYNLHFAGPPRTMDLGLLYRALNAHQVDMIAANSTDGPIQAFGLAALQDDRHYFPPYQAVPLVRDRSSAPLATDSRPLSTPWPEKSPQTTCAP